MSNHTTGTLEQKKTNNRPTGVQLKREAKLLTMIGLNTKHARYLKVNYKGILVYEILMDCVARKRIQKTTSNYLKWFPRYCDFNFYKFNNISLIFMSSYMTL